MRNHSPVLIEEFNGLWRRGDPESTPMDHFSDCNNLQFIQSGFRTRDGIDVVNVGGKTISDVVRMYMYVHQNDEGLLVLDSHGNIYHTKSPTPLVPILSVTGMTDFAFVNISGRAYISPHDGAIGLQDEFVYMYDGEGNPARAAAGNKPVDADGALAAANSATVGNVEAGIHIFGVVYETDSGFLSSFGPDTLPTVTTPGNKKVDLSNIPISPSSSVTARRVVASKLIQTANYTGNTRGYQLYFVPNGRIADNTTTTLPVNFYDAELLEDASHLEDLFEAIPAGAVMGIFHNRMIVGSVFGAFNNDPSLDESGLNSTAYLSFPGEPEAIDQVDGLIVAPLDSKPLTNAQEYRDVLYIFKQTRTLAYTDNGDNPTSWPLIAIDQGVGASIHGIATVLDSGGINVDYLLVTSLDGIMLFNGAYNRPELTWKIKDFWAELDRDNFKYIQLVNDSVDQKIYMCLPDRKMLYADYSNGLAADKIRWCPWEFRARITTITLININALVVGSDGEL